MDNVNHFRRMAIWWVVLSIICTAVVVLLLAPGMPPGNGSDEAAGQVVDNTVLMGLSTPVALAVLVPYIYMILNFREKDHESTLEGPAVKGDAKLQTWWLVVTTTIVLFLAGYGTVRMLQGGAGGGQGPNPIAKPAGAAHAFQVQVIGQQWRFTYRYPQYGGLQTGDLVLPAHTLIEFNVTSLDVIHSFWAYQLAVKADANPGVNNIAYVTTRGPLHFNVRCAELCGLWHGYMFDQGRVVTRAAFTQWIASQKVKYAPVSKYLTPYAKKYNPAPQRRGG